MTTEEKVEILFDAMWALTEAYPNSPAQIPLRKILNDNTMNMKDISYQELINKAIELANEFGEAGRWRFIDFSKQDGTCTKDKVNRVYDNILKTVKKPISFEELFNKFTEWSVPTFKESTELTSLHKLGGKHIEGGELLELYLALENETTDEKILEEYVDCFMCLLDSMARAGYNMIDFLPSFQKKLEKNKSREWNKNEDNTYSHKKENMTKDLNLGQLPLKHLDSFPNPTFPTYQDMKDCIDNKKENINVKMKPASSLYEEHDFKEYEKEKDTVSSNTTITENKGMEGMVREDIARAMQQIQQGLSSLGVVNRNLYESEMKKNLRKNKDDFKKNYDLAVDAIKEINFSPFSDYNKVFTNLVEIRDFLKSQI